MRYVIRLNSYGIDRSGIIIQKKNKDRGLGIEK